MTPFLDSGEVDVPSLLRLLAYFEAAGCEGVVLAGTNGEGPSLAAVEKRDLLRTAAQGRGRLRLILGISTPSLTEAKWLCSQAAKSGADAVLLMAPGAFRQAPLSAVEAWLFEVVSGSPVPVLVYNFPKMCGFSLSAEAIHRLSKLDAMIGVKDSSGERDNLVSYRAAVAKDQSLFVGDETLLMEALQAGWTGTISGAANTLPTGLCRVLREWTAGAVDQAATWFRLVEPVIRAVRSHPQPATYKAVLHALGVISWPTPRLPLEVSDPQAVLEALERALGVRPGELGLPNQV